MISYANSHVENISRYIYDSYQNEMPQQTLQLFSFRVSELLYSYIYQTLINPVKIVIYSTCCSDEVILFKNAINSLYSSKSILIVEQVEDAEIVISDSLIKLKPNQTFFYFEDFHCTKSWKKLCEFIQMKIIEKN